MRGLFSPWFSLFELKEPKLAFLLESGRSFAAKEEKIPRRESTSAVLAVLLGIVVSAVGRSVPKKCRAAALSFAAYRRNVGAVAITQPYGDGRSPVCAEDASRNPNGWKLPDHLRNCPPGTAASWET